MDKLKKLAEIEGYGHDINNLLRDASFDSACYGICMNPGCDYTTEVEPDQFEGYCESCGTQSVRSALALAGVI